MANPETASRAFRTHHLVWQILDWVYPPRCAACGTAGVRWCKECSAKVRVLPSLDICPLCGIPQMNADICPECSAYQPVYTALRSWGSYEGTLRTAVHRLKYHSDVGLGEELAKPLTSLLWALGWPVDLVTAVPLSRQRQLERGYNQAALLARWVSLSSGLQFHPKAIQRLRNTTSQVGLHAHQRRENMAGAFTAMPMMVAGKSVLIIDDVTTTGATMQACAAALKSAGASRIYGLTLARAGHIHLS